MVETNKNKNIINYVNLHLFNCNCQKWWFSALGRLKGTGNLFFLYDRLALYVNEKLCAQAFCLSSVSFLSIVKSNFPSFHKLFCIFLFQCPKLGQTLFSIHFYLKQEVNQYLFWKLAFESIHFARIKVFKCIRFAHIKVFKCIHFARMKVFK